MVHPWSMPIDASLKFKAGSSDNSSVDELTREFLIESQEGLDRMERGLTDLEARPGDTALLAGVRASPSRLEVLRRVLVQLGYGFACIILFAR